jgi:uncharacterized protein YkwD
MKSWIRSLSLVIIAVFASETVLTAAQASRGTSGTGRSYQSTVTTTSHTTSRTTRTRDTRRQPSDQPPPAGLSLQQTVLNLINQARAQTRQCGTVTYPATKPVIWNTQLEAAAQGHSNDMASHNFFSHTGSDGLNVASRVTAQDYRWRTVGENIAAGTTTAEATVNLWLSSAGHCANIMNPAFSEIGAAKAENSASDYRIYWTLVLANRY